MASRKVLSATSLRSSSASSQLVSSEGLEIRLAKTSLSKKTMVSILRRRTRLLLNIGVLFSPPPLVASWRIALLMLPRIASRARSCRLRTAGGGSWTSLDCPDSERQGWTRGAKETARIFFVSQAEGPVRVILVNYLKDKTRISKGFGH